MEDYVLFHLVPLCYGNENLGISASARAANHVSPSARGDDGLVIGFHRTIDQDLRDRVPRERNKHLVDVTLLRLHSELETSSSCDTQRDEPSVIIRAMFHTQRECVSLRLIPENSVNYDPSNHLFSWEYMSHDEPQPCTMYDDGISNCRFGDDATIRVGALRLDLVWARPNLRPGEDIEYVLLNRAKAGHRERMQRKNKLDYSSRPALKAAATPSKHTRRTVSKHNILPGQGKQIGKGSYNTVVYRRRTDLPYREVIAVKEVLDLAAGNAAAREINQLQRIGANKHIVGYFGHYVPDHNAGAPVEIYLDLYDGDLSILHQQRRFKNSHNNNYFGLPLHEQMLHQVLLALKFLADWNVCHRDVKPQNILYRRSGERYDFALSDFGISRVAGNGNTIAGTDQYKAPEVFDAERDARPVMDIWSLAVTLMEIHPDIPFNLDIPAYDRYKVAEKLAEFTFAFPEYEPMTHEDPQRRASAEWLLHQRFKPRGLPIRVSARAAEMERERRSWHSRYLD